MQQMQPGAAAPVDTALPIAIMLPLGDAMRLIGLLGQLPINSGMAPIAEAIIAQTDAQVQTEQMKPLAGPAGAEQAA